MSFSQGSFVYTFYSYLNKFHTEPSDWRSLVEYMEYNRIENKIAEVYSDQAMNKG